VEAKGTREKQLTAGLFIIDTRTSPSRQEHVRVHAGQTVETADEVLEVTEVVDRGDAQLLRLRLRPREP